MGLSDGAPSMKGFVFPIVRRDFAPKPQPELLENFDAGHPIDGTKCMRCSEPRWAHPTSGELVLCRDHAHEVARGEARAPALRRNIDCQATSRKVLIVDQLPDDPSGRT